MENGNEIHLDCFILCLMVSLAPKSWDDRNSEDPSNSFIISVLDEFPVDPAQGIENRSSTEPSTCGINSLMNK